MKHTKKMKKFSTAVALLGCAVSAGAMAQSSGYDRSSGLSYNPSWYVAPSISASHPDAKFGSDHHGEGLGLRVGKAISPSWDIQFGPTYSRQRFAGTRYQQNTLGVDALYMFSRERFRPFVLVGAGAEYDKVNRGNFRADDTSPYVNAGVGFQYAFGEQWGMQADVRRAHSYLRGNEFGFDRANTNTLTVGLTYTFGKRRALAPAVSLAPTPVVPMQTAVVPAPPPVVPTPVPTPAPPRFERYTLSSTELFEFDSAVLRMPQPKLDETVDVMSSNAQVTNVTITGHTDRIGSPQYNQKLSERRADAVKGYLTTKGIAASRLNTVGKGESTPVVTCTNKKRSDLIICLEPNRRVEVEQIVIERRIP
ncbi:MAG: OmpA family protein [Betaproteobacteria bacterium]|nr:OmpA family protein [Betaproteobacteria bacterium]